MTGNHNGSTPEAEMRSVLTQTDRLSVSGSGDLMIEACSARDLLARYGSPLYVVSEATLRQNYRRIHRAFADAWPKEITILYAIKANNNLAVRAILHQEGAGGECFGESELYATFLGGADPEKVVLNGSNKSSALLKRAAELGVTVNIDAEDEIDILADLASEASTPIRVSLRIKFLADAFDSISTDYFGGSSLLEHVQRMKWGFSPETAERLVNRILDEKGLDLRGYHFHIGRASRDPDYQRIWGNALGEMVSKLHDKTGFAPKVLDIGGGWPRERDPESRSLALNPHRVEDYATTACSALLQALETTNLPTPDLWVEPGRYIVGNAVVFLATVGAIKHDLGLTWVNLDASTNDLMRIDTNGSAYHVFPATGMRRVATNKAAFVGETCIDSVFSADRFVPELKRGEPIAILDAGMYAETSSTQFNGVPRPATVLVNGARAEIIKERESVSDVFSKHRIPERIRAHGSAP